MLKVFFMEWHFDIKIENFKLQEFTMKGNDIKTKASFIL